MPRETPPSPATEPDPTTRPSVLERIGSFFFAWRNWVFSVGLIMVLAVFEPVPFQGEWHRDVWLDGLGLGVTLLGQVIRILVIGYTPIRSGGAKKKVAAEALHTSGLLNHVRNPLYVGNILVTTGLALIHNHPYVYALILPLTLFAYVAIVAAEEAFLTRRFGDSYREYCRRVPRWFPQLHGLGASLREARFDRRRVMRQEYGSLWIALAFPLALMLYERWGEPGAPNPALWQGTLSFLLALTTAAWAYLYFQKKAEVARRGFGAAFKP
jgi:protein-S-isoprenylcysteine O-methyltransferase Ste14